MANAYRTPGSGRFEIDEILKCLSFNQQYVQQAKTEYNELLRKEVTLAEKDLDMYKSIYQKNMPPRIASYTKFGEELRKKYPQSYLVMLICESYRIDYRQTHNNQRAMIEYNILQEVSLAYEQKNLQREKASPTGYSQTQISTQPQSSSYSPQYSKSMSFPYGSHPAMTTTGQTAVSVVADQPMRYQGQTYYPESMYNELLQHKKAQEEDIYSLQKELNEKKKEVDDLRNRLSSFASNQLTQGNPDFTDLSDINRPAKMAEKFHKIYDDEWTTSLESLTKGSINLTEEKAISVLMEIIKSIYAFCANYAKKQTEKMVMLWKKAVDDPFLSAYSVDVTLSSGSSPDPSKAVVDEFKQHRKSFHKECIKMAIKNFKENVITKSPQIDKKWLPAVDAYIDVCVEVLWLMCVQNPPMVIKWPEPNTKFDSENYKEYCKKGKIVKLAVWPAVFLNDNGPLMDKGYAMPA